MNENLQKSAAQVSFFFPIVYLFIITILGLFVNGYSPLSDSMSELGAVDSPVRHLANFGGFMLVGVGLLVFAFAFFRTLKHSILNYVTALLIMAAGLFMFIVSFFPCDSGCVDATNTSRWHSIISTPPAILLPIAAMLSTRLFYGNEHIFPRRYQIASFWLGLLSLMSGPLLMVGVASNYLGLIQRLGIGFSLAWVCVVSYRIMQLNKLSKRTK